MTKWFKVYNPEFNQTTWINTEHITAIEHDIEDDVYSITYGDCEMLLPKKEGEELIKIMGI